ncbi:hypothetical protein EVAR_2909_1 [Eumeta japonica]|uniref:Uncharacterized protein n=1 Tax=Eumeta variegata TaxID=151549 RepID=A0A4C1T3G3_EUMVA|nr:hypothetical protein EVAR_2909_1 [Eumeta japonica]
MVFSKSPRESNNQRGLVLDWFPTAYFEASVSHALVNPQRWPGISPWELMPGIVRLDVQFVAISQRPLLQGLSILQAM